MVFVLTMRMRRSSIVSTSKMLKRLGRIPTNTTPSAMQEWGKILERDMKESARQAGLHPWGGSGLPSLFNNGIQWRQKPRGRIGRLFVVLHGVLIDGGGTIQKHVVALKPGRTITKWAKDVLGKQPRTTKPFDTLVVRSHPFIKNGYVRARPKLNLILKKHLREI